MVPALPCVKNKARITIPVNKEQQIDGALPCPYPYLALIHAGYWRSGQGEIIGPRVGSRVRVPVSRRHLFSVGFSQTCCGFSPQGPSRVHTPLCEELKEKHDLEEAGTTDLWLPTLVPAAVICEAIHGDNSMASCPVPQIVSFYAQT